MSDETERIDMDEVSVERSDNRAFDDAQRRVAQRKAAREAAQAAPESQATPDAEQAEELPEDDRSILQRTISHLSPIEFAGGALDAFDENFNTLRQLSESGNEFLMEKMGIPGLILDENGPRLTTDSGELHETDDFGALLPDLGDEQRGSFARGIGQFAGNFVGLGKAFKGLNVLQGTSRAAMAGNATLRGGLGTFAGFEGMDNPVNGLVEAFPSAEGAITEFLDSDAEDPELLNKLRNGLLDAGAGTAIDGAMFLLRNVRHARTAAGDLDKVADDVARAEQVVETSRTRVRELLGDPDSSELIARKNDVSSGAKAHDGATSDAIFDEPIGLARQPVVRPDLADLDEDAFDAAHQAANRRLDNIERSYDELPELVDTDADFRRAMIEAQDDYTSFELEYFRRGLDEANPAATAEDLAQDMRLLNLSDSEDKVKALMIVEEMNRRGGDAQAAFERAMASWAKQSPDHAEVLRGKIEDLGSTIEEAGRLSIGEGGASQSASSVPPKSPDVDPASDEVFINWARIDSEDDVKQIIQDLADADAPKIHEARRGVQTNEATQQLADEENAWEILSQRRKGEPLNASQSVAVRRLWTSSGRKTMELAQRVQAGGGAMEQAAFRKMLSVHATIQEQVIAARTETARALQSWRIPAGDVAEFSVGLDDLIRQTDLDPTTKQLAESLTTLGAMGHAEAADAFVYGAGRLGTLQKAGVHASDMIRQLYYASMLSGPHTHMRNLIGNTGMMGLNVAERKLANVMGSSLGDAQVVDGEAGAMMYGMVQGARDAFRMSSKSREAAEAQGRIAGGFVDSVRTGDSGFGIGKVDAKSVGAFSSEKLRVDPESTWGKALDYLDGLTTVPTRALGASDEIFKSANYRAEVMSQAHRKAQKELAEGTIDRDGFADRLAELTANPDEYMKLAAVQQAQAATFTGVPKDTRYWQAMQAVARTPVLGKILLPFSRTPYNIAIESIERLPLAPLSKKWREDIMAGGARTDIAIAKMGLGSMFLATAADLAMSGQLTGDMQGLGFDSGREQRQRLGERPMTLRVDTGNGVRTFSFRGLDPLTFSLGIASNTVEILSADDFDDQDKDSQDVAVAAIMAIGAQFSSANYMRGVSEFFDAMSDPTRHSENYFERLVGVVVPTGAAQVARSMDPTLREVNTWWESILSRTPGASMSLQPKMDAHGRELNRESGLSATYDFVSPIYSSKTKPEPADQEFERLGIAFGRPKKSTSFSGVNINLKKFPEAFTAYQRLAGKDMTETVDGAPIVVGSIGYVSEGGGRLEEINSIVAGTHSFSAMYEEGTDGSEGDKAAFLQLIWNEYNKEARRHLVEDFPELRAELQSRADERPQRNFKQQPLNLFGG